MALINVSSLVPNPTETLKDYSYIKFYRSMRGKDGPWAEITSPQTRLPIVVGKLSYAFADHDGASGYWYASSYYQPSTGLESSRSDPMQGQGDPALSSVSVEMVKQNYLFGLDLNDADGRAMPDSLFEFYIKSAMSRMERELGLPLRPKAVTDERHPYYAHNARRYMYTKLNAMPIQSVQAVRFVWPGQLVSQVMPIPADWIRLDQSDGSFEIVPGSSVSSAYPVTGFADTAWAGISGGAGYFNYSAADYVPEVIRVDYLSGFPDGKLPQEIVELVAKAASMGPMGIAGDLLGGAGIASQSVSMDGISQSVGNTKSAGASAYGARMQMYQSEIAEALPKMRTAYRGLSMRVA